MKLHRLFLVAVAVLAIPFAHAQAEKPVLVVFISVDQLRGDLPFMYQDRYGPDGFKRFFEDGTVYTNAHYGHITTYTGCGHAALSTGSNPRENMVIGNDWIDPQTGDSVYCVEDQEHKLLGTSTSTHAGTSPKNLKAQTIGDALVEATGGGAKVISVSRKDRAAILLGGHAGKAFWYDSGSGHFISSDYYYSAYPSWVDKWNAAGHSDAYANAVWDLFKPESTYIRPDDRPFEQGVPLLGKTFPYSLKGMEGRKLYSAISVTPFSDELDVSFAEAAIEAEQLGQRGVTDMLMLGLSVTDSIGHEWGPYSREQEDNMLRLDALLQKFFGYLDQRFGPDKVVVALSADHGVDGYPPGRTTIGQLNPIEMVDTVNAALKEKYGDGDYAYRFKTPYLYFEPGLAETHPDDIADMESIAADALMKMDGVAYAIPAHRIAAHELDEENPVMARVYASYNSDLHGNIVVIQDPYYHIYSGSSPYTATHGTPYSYDTHVPVMFVGDDVPAATIDRTVGPESIAPTIAALLGIPGPDKATGPVLQEVVAGN